MTSHARAAAHSEGRAARLRGRSGEVGVLTDLVAAVRAGQSRVLVVRGEPGVGKTALLDYLAGHADGCLVVRAAGMQAEIELAFAGLHQAAWVPGRGEQRGRGGGAGSDDMRVTEPERAGGGDDELAHRLRGQQRLAALGVPEPRQVHRHQAGMLRRRHQIGSKASRLSGHGLSSRA